MRVSFLVRTFQFQHGGVHGVLGAHSGSMRRGRDLCHGWTFADLEEGCRGSDSDTFLMPPPTRTTTSKDRRASVSPPPQRSGKSIEKLAPGPATGGPAPSRASGNSRTPSISDRDVPPGDERRQMLLMILMMIDASEPFLRPSLL